MVAPSKARIVLVDDQLLSREAVRARLEEEPRLEGAEARDGYPAIAELERARPDGVIIEAHLALQNVIGGMPALPERSPEGRILVLSGDSDSLSELVRSHR